MKSTLLRTSAGLIALTSALNIIAADAKQLILSCQITEGVSEPHRSRNIMVDEDAGIVVFDFNEKVGFKASRESDSCKGCYLDLSMKITLKNEKLLLANDVQSAFAMTKHDGKFVRSSVTPIPLPDGNYAVLGNTLWGTCAKSPFN